MLELEKHDDSLASICRRLSCTDATASTADFSSSSFSFRSDPPSADATVRPVHRSDLRRVGHVGSGKYCKVETVIPNHFGGDSKQPFAKKTIDPKSIKCSRDFRIATSELANEAEIISGLDHENIIKLRGVSSERFSESFESSSDGYFLIMDVLGETLEDRLKRWKSEKGFLKPTKMSVAKNFLRTTTGRSSGPSNDDKHREKLRARVHGTVLGIADGMRYLHSKDIVLRDLKPANIGYRSDHPDDDDDDAMRGNEKSAVKLFDFGMAGPVGDCDDDEAAGSPRYMAPEVMACEGYSLAVDVYSFGVILYEICSLKAPFEESYRRYCRKASWKNAGPKGFWAAVRDDGLTPFYDLEKDVRCPVLRALIEACCDRDPSKRPAFGDIVDRIRAIGSDDARDRKSGGDNDLLATSLRTVPIEYDVLIQGFDDDDDDDDDDSIPRESRIHPGCISHDREAIAFAVGFVLGAPRAVLWSSRRGKLFSVAAACSEIDNTELPAARIQMLAFRLAREGFWRHASLVLRESLVIPHRNDEVVCDEMAPSIDGMILLSTVLIDGLSHGDFCYETIVEAVQYGKKAVVMAEEYHNKTRNRGAARAIAPTGSCLIPSQLKTRRGKGPREPRRRSAVPPPSATESLFPPDALLLVRAKLALGKALSVFAVLTGRNCINLRMLTERGVVPVPLSDDGGGDGNRPNHSPLDPLVAEDDPMWRDLLLNPEVREHIQWSEQFFQEAHRHLSEGMAVCETETERHRRCEPPYADAESDGGVRRESGGDDDAVSIVRGAFLCAFGAWNLQRVTLSVFYRKRLETERYTLRSLADFCDAFRCLTEGALASASRTASTNRPDGGGPRRRYRAAAGENLKSSTGAVVTAVDTLLACGEDMGEVFRYCRQCEVGALDSLSSEFCGGGFASESAGGAEAHRLRTGLVVLAFAELLSVRERGSFHRRRLRFDAFLDKVRSPAALRRRYGAVKAWLVVVAESTREGGDERCAGAPGERGAR